MPSLREKNVLLLSDDLQLFIVPWDTTIVLVLLDFNFQSL